ncbi:DUF4350 domain-containing protein [Cellulomonas fengjieae]|uniref:DUF4350 domain-containing protein n=1 Tax=Cellulomonas fengjieae TaxID=2819978 RepID=A0ABS3SDP4_9CELL|nr:DUF4350 domain-containing protein [Cellulomonas fengjieae]MBO3083881.1 DUF4350 domain-containing protein [Cellulomonas fengjieae]QVI64836.1 DUF4350 domain-containing protein [Cellulomonas fengjieae]
MTTTITPDASVVGDGTSARSRSAHRWRRARWPLGLLALVVLAGLLTALPAPQTSTVTLAPDNPADLGGRAAAQILGQQGVDVRYVRRLAQVESLAGPGSTVLVVGDYLLEAEQVEALGATGADLVLVDAGWALSLLTDAITAGGSASGEAEVRTAQCDDPDAVAAGRITARGELLATGAGAVVCFPGPESQRGGAYAVVESDGRRIAALADVSPLTNQYLADEGNAALVLRALGRHERLVWYIPSLDDAMAGGEEAGTDTSAVLPPVVPILGLQLLLVVAVAALWRGRRLGRLVTEPMPVVVRAGETTRGRGRLYRRARSYGHAAAALRAGTAARSAARLGLPRSAPAPLVVDAVARATGRRSADVEALLYGPPPTDDRGLAQLARDLDHLESEVHRP